MRSSFCSALVFLWLICAAESGHATVESSDWSGTERLAEISEPVKENVGVWLCWYEGAPIYRLPIVSGRAIVRSAAAGEILDVEAVEKSPFGIEWLRVREKRRPWRSWIPLAYCRRVAPENARLGDLPIGEERVGPREGLPVGYRPSDLVCLPQCYCYNDMPQLLRVEAAQACERMLDAARREARLRILVLSAFRSARTQAYLCKRKIDSAGIVQGAVARPGHSEHQLGTTVDLVGGDGLYLLDERFGFTREGRWLRVNCERFGFVRTYTKQRSEREGTAFEPWHFRYVGRGNIERFETENDEDVW